MDVTEERISHMLELREILLSFQTNFNLFNASVVCAFLESISGLEPSSVMTEPRYLKLVTVSSFCPFTLVSVFMSLVLFVIIAEEQAGFRAGRSTTEQIFNLSILYERYLQHQQDLYHVFMDFKKAFDRVWHAALWATMKKYNISTNLIQVIKNLYNEATSAVLFNGSMGDWF